LEKVLRIIC